MGFGEVVLTVLGVIFLLALIHDLCLWATRWRG
jgi:hypothetical protein